MLLAPKATKYPDIWKNCLQSNNISHFLAELLLLPKPRCQERHAQVLSNDGAHHPQIDNSSRFWQKLSIAPFVTYVIHLNCHIISQEPK